jgi:hypothetical protein
MEARANLPNTRTKFVMKWSGRSCRLGGAIPTSSATHLHTSCIIPPDKEGHVAMKQGDTKEEAMSGWDKWHEIQSQIKDVEYLMTLSDECQEEYLARLVELREAGVAARIRLGRQLKRMGK